MAFKMMEAGWVSQCFPRYLSDIKPRNAYIDYKQRVAISWINYVLIYLQGQFFAFVFIIDIE